MIVQDYLQNDHRGCRRRCIPWQPHCRKKKSLKETTIKSAAAKSRLIVLRKCSILLRKCGDLAPYPKHDPSDFTYQTSMLRWFQTDQIRRPALPACLVDVLVLVLVLSNTKVHRLDCSSARIFGLTNPHPAPALHVVVFVVAFVVVVVVVLHSASCLCFAYASQRFAMHGFESMLPTVCTNHHVHPTTVYTNHRLHQATVYTSHRLHQPPFTPTTVYTTPPFTPTTVCTTPPFTPSHGLHQPPCTPNRGLHQP